MDVNIDSYAVKAHQLLAAASTASGAQLKGLDKEERLILKTALKFINHQSEQLFKYSESEIDALTEKLRLKASKESPANESPTVKSRAKEIWNTIKDLLALHHIGFRVSTDKLSLRITQAAASLDGMRGRLDQLKKDRAEKQSQLRSLQPQTNTAKAHQILGEIANGNFSRVNQGLAREKMNPDLRRELSELEALFKPTMNEEDLSKIREKTHSILTTFHSDFQEANAVMGQRQQLVNDLQSINREQRKLEKLVTITKLKEEANEAMKSKTKADTAFKSIGSILVYGVGSQIQHIKGLEGKPLTREDAIKIARNMTMEGRVLNIVSDEEVLAAANKIIDLKSMIGKTMTREDVVTLATTMKDQMIHLVATARKAQEEADSALISKVMEFNTARGDESMNEKLLKQNRMSVVKNDVVIQTRTKEEALEYSLEQVQTQMNNFCTRVDEELEKNHPDLFKEMPRSQVEVSKLDSSLQQVSEVAERIVTNPLTVAKAERTYASNEVDRMSIQSFETRLDQIQENLKNGVVTKEEAQKQAKAVKAEFQKKFESAVQRFENANAKATYLTIEENRRSFSAEETRKRSSSAVTERPSVVVPTDAEKIKGAVTKKVYEMNVKINQSIEEKYGDLLEAEKLTPPPIRTTAVSVTEPSKMAPVTEQVTKHVFNFINQLAKVRENSPFKVEGEGSYGEKIAQIKTQARALHEAAREDLQKLVERNQADPSHVQLLDAHLNKFYKDLNLETSLNKELNRLVDQPFNRMTLGQANARFRELRNQISFYVNESKPFLPSLTLTKLKAETLRKLIGELNKAGGPATAADRNELQRAEQMLANLDKEIETLTDTTLPKLKKDEVVESAKRLRHFQKEFFRSAIENIDSDLKQGKINSDEAQALAQQAKEKFIKNYSQYSRRVIEGSVEAAKITSKQLKAVDKEVPAEILEQIKKQDKELRNLEVDINEYVKSLEDLAKKFPRLFP